MKIKRMLACCVLLVPILAGCAGGGSQSTAGDSSPNPPATQAATAQTPQTEPSYPTEPAPAAVAVETPYGSLYYQEKWADTMVTRQEQTADGLRVSFSTELEGTEYLLFAVTLGGSEANAGLITDEQGTQSNVFVELGDLGDLSSLTQEQKNYLYAIQEDINFLIQKLNEKE